MLRNTKIFQKSPRVGQNSGPPFGVPLSRDIVEKDILKYFRSSIPEGFTADGPQIFKVLEGEFIIYSNDTYQFIDKHTGEFGPRLPIDPELRSALEGEGISYNRKMSGLNDGNDLVSCTVNGWQYDYYTNYQNSGQCQLVNVKPGHGEPPTPCIPPECASGGGPAYVENRGYNPSMSGARMGDIVACQAMTMQDGSKGYRCCDETGRVIWAAQGTVPANKVGPCPPSGAAAPPAPAAPETPPAPVPTPTLPPAILPPTITPPPSTPTPVVNIPPTGAVSPEVTPPASIPDAPQEPIPSQPTGLYPCNLPGGVCPPTPAQKVTAKINEQKRAASVTPEQARRGLNPCGTPEGSACPGHWRLTPEQRMIVEVWPQDPKQTAYDMASKYGAADAATPDRLIWLKAECWRTTVVHRDGVDHYWPTPHQDFIEQTVDYKLPKNSYGIIPEFDGSVSFSRTSGTLTSMGNSEEENFLMINLANSVATGSLSLNEAKIKGEKIWKGFMERGERHPWTQAIQFELSAEYSGDPGKPAF